MSVKESKLKTLLADIITSLGLEFWGLELKQQGKDTVLRIYIENKDGVSVDDCANVSRQASSVLDVEDPIASEYTLEVSSPGMDRPLFTLDQFKQHVGENVTVKLRVAFDGRRKFSGRLNAIEDDDIVVQIDAEEYLLPFDTVDKANVVPKF